MQFEGIVRQTSGSSEQVLSTRSVDLNLARRFNAGTTWSLGSRRVATIEFTLGSGVATRRENFVRAFPSLKAGLNSGRRYASNEAGG